MYRSYNDDTVNITKKNVLNGHSSAPRTFKSSKAFPIKKPKILTFLYDNCVEAPRFMSSIKVWREALCGSYLFCGTLTFLFTLKGKKIGANHRKVKSRKLSGLFLLQILHCGGFL